MIISAKPNIFLTVETGRLSANFEPKYPPMVNAIAIINA
jgi:hypothetical protein